MSRRMLVRDWLDLSVSILAGPQLQPLLLPCSLGVRRGPASLQINLGGGGRAGRPGGISMEMEPPNIESGRLSPQQHQRWSGRQLRGRRRRPPAALLCYSQSLGHGQSGGGPTALTLARGKTGTRFKGVQRDARGGNMQKKSNILVSTIFTLSVACCSAVEFVGIWPILYKQGFHN